jgi:hypothetical protein
MTVPPDCVSGEKPWYKAWTFVAAASGMGTFGAAGLVGWGAGGVGAGLVFGFLLGMCLSRSFGRLRSHAYEPEVCVTGMVDEQWKNDGLFVPPLALWGKLGIGAMKYFERDGDWLFNLIILDNQSHVITEAYDGSQAQVRRKADCTPYLHCEISSNEGPLGCYGSVVGAAVGAAVSLAFIAPLAASCAAWGPFFWVCLLLVAVLALLVTYLGSVIGGLIGAGAGKLADEIEGQGKLSKGVKKGDCVTFCGEWITDMDHGWNELHELKTIQVHEDIPAHSISNCMRKAATKSITIK